MFTKLFNVFNFVHLTNLLLENINPKDYGDDKNPFNTKDKNKYYITHPYDLCLTSE